ncbi:HORMA domain-containing protein [Aspergillus californicus]
MVRIKYTGPLSAVRPHHPQVRGNLLSDSTASASSPAPQIQNATNGHPESQPEKGLLLKQQQSLEMVKIMLHVSVGTLFYLREFLPLPCFDDRDLKEAQKQQKFSYRDFIDNKSSSSHLQGDSDNAFGTGRRKCQPLKVIIRDSDPKANLILDVLETGIFDALSRSVLEAVQLTILVDKEAPDNVLESYTFSFKYSNGLGDLRGRLESLSIEPFGYVADMKSAHTARVALEAVIRRLITLSAFLPTLPNKRTLGVHLFYTEDCPTDYEPPGFTGARDGIINYPLTENWMRESQACGRMESGWHTVGLKVSSLKYIGQQPEAPQIPTQMEYNDAVPRVEDIGFEDDESQLLNSQSTGSSQEATQDVAERERLQLMMPSQEEPSSNIDLIPTQPVKPISMETDDAEPVNPNTKFTLKKDKIATIRKSLQLQRDNGKKDSELPKQGSIRCQCDWDEEEGPMVECSFCHTRQHLLCYGYENASMPKVADVHACYECLLEPNASQKISKMKELVLTRKVLRVIFDEGYPNYTSSFAEKIHCNGPEIVRITNQLVAKELLKPTFGYKMKGFLKKGLPKYTIPDLEDVRLTIHKKIMDPMVEIKCYYTEQQNPNSIEAPSPPATSENDGQSNLNSQDKPLPTNGYQTEESETEKPKDKPIDTPPMTRSLRRKTIQSNMQSATSTGGRKGVIFSTPQPVNKDTPRSNRRTRSSQLGTEQRDIVSSPPQSVDQDTPRLTRKRTRSSQVGTESQYATPSQSTTDQEPTSDSPRRSGRKRRKISNYAKFIDVGAQTSGDENA